MSINTPQHYALQFSTNLQLLLQQRGTKLRMFVTEHAFVGEAASPVDQFASIEASEVNDRFAPMPRTDYAVDRRWCLPTDYDINPMVDSFDKLRVLADPTSSAVQNVVNALGRKIDDTILTAAFGAAATGKLPTTSSTSFGATVSTSGGQNVAVAFGAASAVNLTVAKLIEGKRVLIENEVDVDNDPLICPISDKEWASLMQEPQFVSNLYNSNRILENGKIPAWQGIEFPICNRIDTGTDDASGTSNAIPLYAKSGLHVGFWNDINVDVSERKDIRGIPVQAYGKLTVGATRSEEKKVVRIWCR